jgi:predicted transcriptional regulator
MEEPVIRASITRTVVVGPDLRRRLDEGARVMGGDASWLARRILTEHLDTHVHPQRAEPEES